MRTRTRRTTMNSYQLKRIIYEEMYQAALQKAYAARTSRDRKYWTAVANAAAKRL